MVNTEHPQDDEIDERCRVLDKRLKVIEGQAIFDLDALDMCLVSGLVKPLKFKILNFEKYIRDSYPKHNLVMFY